MTDEPEAETLARSWRALVPSMTDAEATEAAELVLSIQRKLDEMLTDLRSWRHGEWHHSAHRRVGKTRDGSEQARARAAQAKGD